MYLQNEELGEASFTEERGQQLSNPIENEKLDVVIEHDKWKKQRENKKCKDFSKMSYWQKISHNTTL